MFPGEKGVFGNGDFHLVGRAQAVDQVFSFFLQDRGHLGMDADQEVGAGKFLGLSG